ncbi:MAG: 1-acyl-sn-glycerol-3-phosphate acyltransferase [Candidatus Aminicenantes bacterium]|nr:1-acyl-sn-glycerol-3-phosphate acyltransferase [Candidatus Aminicenantes bacterium]
MPTFEDEFRRYFPIARIMSRFSLLGKKLVVRGTENFVRDGPSIIVGNHCGSFKDVAVISLTAPRPFFFTANKMIFNREELSFLVRKHLKRHLGRGGLLLNFLLNPLYRLFIRFVSSNVAKVGTIPVDLYNHGKRQAVERCQDYLKAGRIIVALQGRGRVVPEDPNPYVKSFGRGMSIVAYNVYERFGMSVPVTPLAIYGTQLPFLIPGKLLVNVGKPMFMADHLGGGFETSVERFKAAMESAVNQLFLELIRA